jgi:hypothetical protein
MLLTRCACCEAGTKLACTREPTQFAIPTHRALLQDWLTVGNNVHCHWLPHPPARIWADADGSANRNAGIRAALLQCCTAVSHAHGWACRRCILCNLFSLEGGPTAELCVLHALVVRSCDGALCMLYLLDYA